MKCRLVCITLGFPILNMKLGNKVLWDLLINSIHLKTVCLIMMIFEFEGASVREMMNGRDRLSMTPEIAYFDRESCTQDAVDHDEVCSHKDIMLHYETVEKQVPLCSTYAVSVMELRSPNGWCRLH
ncbi:predicted protein [Lichtheimia corymbifera JMRC:FSU:9682]|uniref:Uncharacterized protein n=1 Tax=Lichtheimia corymbifera JMRC:FSU:9682 TaxID=1263082 RepID=A0A068RPE8_9FUNG|nr:predicted protein [Lichtheimia corymbifera JMRC:FSU:9682]